MENQHLKLRQRYTFLDFLYYTALGAIPFYTAAYAIANRSVSWLFFYLFMSIAAFFLVYRHYCSHCPHYTREGKTTRCIFLWGMPKFFRRRPEPLGFVDKSVTVLAAFFLCLFPLYWLLQQPGLLIIFFLSLAVFAATIYRNECRQCIYLDCPMNRVPEDQQ
jgi:hypothetical protein